MAIRTRPSRHTLPISQKSPNFSHIALRQNSRYLTRDERVLRGRLETVALTVSLGGEADAYKWLPRNQGVATMKFSASAGEANGPTNLPECLFLNVVPSTHSCSSRYVSPLRNSSTSAARFPSSL